MAAKETKFAPGPWTLEITDMWTRGKMRRLFQINADAVEEWVIEGEVHDGVERDSHNLALITAAPTMFAALEEALEVIDTGRVWETSPELDAINSIKAALEMATTLTTCK